MIEKNLEIRDKFINKLFIKLENLNNDLILLSKVDKKIYENIINQKGGHNLNLGLLNLYDIKNKIKKNESNINIFTKLIKSIANKPKNLIIFFTTLTALLKNIKKIEQKHISTNYKEVTSEDIKVLFEYIDLDLPNRQDALNNPKYKEAIEKIGEDTFKYFLKIHNLENPRPRLTLPSPRSSPPSPQSSPLLTPLPQLSPRSPSQLSPRTPSQLSPSADLYLKAAIISAANAGNFDDTGTLKPTTKTKTKTKTKTTANTTTNTTTNTTKKK